MTTRSSLLFALLFTASCSSSGSEGAPGETDSAAVDVSTSETVEEDSSSPIDSAIAEVLGDAPVDADFGPFPPGPYGNKVGDVMANLQWEGYLDDLADAVANTKPYVAMTSMDALRKKAPKGYALVHVSEFY
jgi:hypothetical protein